MPAPPVIADLVERFDQQGDAYRSGHYNEAQLRKEFVDPMFKALGWDMDNISGYAEAYKDVIHEDAIKIGGATKAPDYCFRIGGTRKFFLEAKKPSVDIKTDAHPAYQLRRYAWSAKLPLSILTDFEEFAVYDCRVEPKLDDKASVARVLYLDFREYAPRWDDIAKIFERDAILKGSFDKFAESTKAKLDEIERWRADLARNLALRNPKLSQRDLNFSVQRTIDRIVFLRICEDRRIEVYGRLQALLNGEHTYRRLYQLFREADQRYNSGLFYFQKERDRVEPPDDLTPELEIDDSVLKKIIRRLYYPDSPYEFSVLPADILGQVYEQFLGKVIRLTEGHQAKVEDKPEVKKAGGVYYTPTYIVDYIVKNTVGKLLDNKTPKQASKLRIVDSACGSGSFLITAYQYLLNWHRDWYVADDPKKWATGRNPALYRGMGGEWKLTTTERKRILLQNIFGVDIDAQAVEVTKLSLLLKVLEGESEQTLATQLRFYHERALPDLGRNIKCGNSLICPDFYDQQEMDFLDEEERYRINVFDWNAEFGEILKAGGFDAVIGNPPYVRIQTMKEWAPLEVEFYKKRYASAAKGNYDIYVVFVERGLSLLNNKGQLGFILPHKFFNAQYGEALRELLATGHHVREIVHFGHQQVFADATTYTSLLFLSKKEQKSIRFLSVGDLERWRRTGEIEEATFNSSIVTSGEWNFATGVRGNLLRKLETFPGTLGTVAARIAQGIRTSANEVYVLDVISSNKEEIVAFSKQLERKVALEQSAVSQFLQGREIKAYQISSSGKVVIIPYDKFGRLLGEQEYKRKFPKTFRYLEHNRDYLSRREKGRMKGSNWYAYIYPKNQDVMQSKKILVPDIADRAAFALDEHGEYAFTSGYAITLRSDVKESLKYLLAVLNSKVVTLYLKHVSTPLRGGFFRYFTQFMEKMPIARLNMSDPADKDRHDRMVSLVERMLELHKQLAAAKTEYDRTNLQRQKTEIDLTRTYFI